MIIYANTQMRNIINILLYLKVISMKNYFFYKKKDD